jgi:phage gp36-like protein
MTPDYVTKDQLEIIIAPQVMAMATDDSPSDSFVTDTSILDDHLAIAESRVESYLLEYDLEQIEDDPPPVIIWAVTFIAAYTLFQRSDLTTSEDVRESYMEVMNWLSEVQEGKATIPGLDSYDETFTGFGDTSTMYLNRIPHSDSIPTL